MSFRDRSQRLTEKIEKTDMTILVWGPGKQAGRDGQKRKEIRERLKTQFQNADVKFSEELSRDPELMKGPIGSSTLRPDQQELFHLAVCDICVVLDTSKGAGEEIARFTGTPLAYKLLILTSEQFKKAKSFPASVRQAGNQVFYTKAEYQSCNLIEHVLNHVRYVAFCKMLEIHPA